VETPKRSFRLAAGVSYCHRRDNVRGQSVATVEIFFSPILFKHGALVATVNLALCIETFSAIQLACGCGVQANNCCYANAMASPEMRVKLSPQKSYFRRRCSAGQFWMRIVAHGS
jgi:hypothetical protein